MSATPGDLVRLVRPAAGLPAGAEGVLVGWYVTEDPVALISFGTGAPVRVPLDAYEPAPWPRRWGGSSAA